jgi:aspartate/methionine/tyrosine aminotransferase
MAAPRVAERFRNLKHSPTVEMSERVRAARADGREIIAMSSGDPNMPTDSRIIDAAERALRNGATHYSSSGGERSLREAIVRREQLRSGASYQSDDVIVTPGGKFAVLTALMGIIEPGDEVIVLQPSWVSYGPCVRLCGGVLVQVDVLDRFDVEAIERALTPATRAIIVNSPVNPTGRVICDSEIAKLVEMADERGLWIIFDQVYADLTYNGPVAFPQSSERGFSRTLVVDSLSKSFGMTGWRLGYLAMPPGLARYVVKFIQHSIYCVPAFIQAAGVQALELGSELLPAYRAMFGARVRRGASALADVAGMHCELPSAGFFLFPRVQGDDVAIAQSWLDELNIAVLPGSVFGSVGAGHLRISLSCPDGDLDVALERIARAGVTV